MSCESCCVWAFIYPSIISRSPNHTFAVAARRVCFDFLRPTTEIIRCDCRVTYYIIINHRWGSRLLLAIINVTRRLKLNASYRRKRCEIYQPCRLRLIGRKSKTPQINKRKIFAPRATKYHIYLIKKINLIISIESSWTTMAGWVLFQTFVDNFQRRV